MNETSDFDKAEREDEFNQQDEVSENDLTQDVDTVIQKNRCTIIR